jgi:hypothetical protein
LIAVRKGEESAGDGEAGGGHARIVALLFEEFAGLLDVAGDARGAPAAVVLRRGDVLPFGGHPTMS